MANTTFPLLLLVARPAAGKSEIIHYLENNIDDSTRENEFHLGKMQVIDDFPFLWRWFEEDELLSRMGKERLYSDQDGYFKDIHYWDLLIQMINLEYEKSTRDPEKLHGHTTILEHSLPDEKLERLYRDCDFSEIAHGNQGMIAINKHDVPFVVFYNYDDVTSKMNDDLGKRLRVSLNSLWQISHPRE